MRLPPGFGVRLGPQKKSPKPSKAKQEMVDETPAEEVMPAERSPIPTGEAVRQARAYLARMEPAVEGRGGDGQTFRAACVLVHDFDLSPEEALPVLQEWNERCQPPWTTRELKRKLEFADCCLEPDRGQKKRQRKNSLKIHIQPDDQNILVGVDCGNESASYVELSTMWAALVKVGRERELAPEMDKLDWQGKRVLLTPPSTVATNQQEVWAEFFLARLLRRKGAVVESLHVPDREGTSSDLRDGPGRGRIGRAALPCLAGPRPGERSQPASSCSGRSSQGFTQAEGQSETGQSRGIRPRAWCPLLDCRRAETGEEEGDQPINAEEGDW